MKATAKTKKTPAQTDMSGFYLQVALEQSQNNILLCDRNLVITDVADDRARRDPRAPQNREIKKYYASLTSSPWWEKQQADEFHLDPTSHAVSSPPEHAAPAIVGALTLSLLGSTSMENRRISRQCVELRMSPRNAKWRGGHGIPQAVVQPGRHRRHRQRQLSSLLGYSLDEIGVTSPDVYDPAFANSLSTRHFGRNRWRRV